jgi:uncharacterized membrane protein
MVKMGSMLVRATGRSPVLLGEDDESKIVEAVRAAESVTSGEIVLHIEPAYGGDPYPRAVYWFNKLALYRTRDRNAVLIFIIEKQKAVVVLGDEGIHRHVGPDFWDAELRQLTDSFKESRFGDGLCAVIARIGDKLKTFFPYQGAADKDELSNTISRS